MVCGAGAAVEREQRHARRSEVADDAVPRSVAAEFEVALLGMH